MKSADRTTNAFPQKQLARLGESKLKKLNSSQKSLGLGSMTEKDLKAKSEIFAAAGVKIIF